MTVVYRRRRRVDRRGTDQRGSAALLVVGLAGVLMTVALLVAVLGGAVADQRRVEAAADLAALAGAGAVRVGGDGCVAARETAGRNGGALRRCAVDGDVVTVEVGREGKAVLGWRLALVGRARAGPVP
jgi:secretion/DNA translocation related TadE-like protein